MVSRRTLALASSPTTRILSRRANTLRRQAGVPAAEFYAHQPPLELLFLPPTPPFWLAERTSASPGRFTAGVVLVVLLIFEWCDIIWACFTAA
jgi:hypothetical protein